MSRAQQIISAIPKRKKMKPSLPIAIDICGLFQFAAGIKNSDFIVAINQDEIAPIFDIAHVDFVGGSYKILFDLVAGIKESRIP